MNCLTGKVVCFECGEPAAGDYAPVPGGKKKVLLCARCLGAVHLGRQRPGCAPYGFVRVDGRLLPVEAEQVVIARARDMLLDGTSDREIARALNDAGERTRMGTAWSHVAVRRVLNRAKRSRSATAG